MISEIMSNLSVANATADVAQALDELPSKMEQVGTKIHDTITGVSTFAAEKGKVDVASGKGTNTGEMWYSFGNQIVNIFNGIRPFVIGLVVVALIVEAIGCIIGGEQSRQRFKQALPWIIGAAILIMMALTVAQGIVNGAQNDFSAGEAASMTKTKVPTTAN